MHKPLLIFIICDNFLAIFVLMWVTLHIHRGAGPSHHVMLPIPSGPVLRGGIGRHHRRISLRSSRGTTTTRNLAHPRRSDQGTCARSLEAAGTRPPRPAPPSTPPREGNRCTPAFIPLLWRGTPQAGGGPLLHPPPQTVATRQSPSPTSSRPPLSA